MENSQVPGSWMYDEIQSLDESSGERIQRVQAWLNSHPDVEVVISTSIAAPAWPVEGRRLVVLISIFYRSQVSGKD